MVPVLQTSQQEFYVFSRVILHAQPASQPKVLAARGLYHVAVTANISLNTMGTP